MKAVISTILPTPAQAAWDLAVKPSTLVYVAKGVLAFQGAAAFPVRWIADRTIATRLLFFGILPGWKHSLHIESIDDSARTIRSRESGGPVTKWDHTIIIEPATAGSSIYTDSIDIQAGLLTFPVWCFAQIFYRHRQRRWKNLVAGASDSVDHA